MTESATSVNTEIRTRDQGPGDGDMAEATDSQVPDFSFISNRYGLLRVAQAVIGFFCLVLVESSASCWYRSFHNYNFFASITSFGMIFAIIVMIFFCFRVQEILEQYINLPLTLCVTEALLCVLYAIASILLIVSYCPSPGLNFLSKIAAVLGIVGSFAFGYAAQISMVWFQTGSLPDIM